MTDKDKAIGLLAFIDISRRNIERAMKADNYYSAALLAEELSREALALAKAANGAARKRNKDRAA
jgi:hypothetical protein